jgi:hypothetical protein
MSTRQGPTLVVLAAGMGSRYGGVKQIDGIGTEGETLLDYAVYDALRSGFSDVVFIIRASIESDFRSTVLTRMGNRVRWDLAFQELDSLIPPASMASARIAGRIKPWGTAHAVLCARDTIHGPFAVINADDFYGREAFAAMGSFLSSTRKDAAGLVPFGALVPYRLDRTLSSSGTVARGICRIENGELVDIKEQTAIQRKDGIISAELPSGKHVELAPDAPVSMNIWGFQQSALDSIESFFLRFLADNADQPKAEAYIPSAVDYMIKQGSLRVRALEADSEWFGMTYREDRDDAVNRIRELVAVGRYPKALWR